MINILVGILITLVIANIVCVYYLFRYITKFQRMVNQALINIFNELKLKVGLRPGERIQATPLHFKGVNISKANGEPMDQITVLEYSNTPIEAKKNE